MKKFAVTLVILLIAAIVVFVIGYIPLQIPAGEYGVITTKTGGSAYPVIKPGDFCWRWERLFPTNLHLITFSLVPVHTDKTVSGELPTADSFAANTATYKYSVSIKLDAALFPDYLPSAVGQHLFSGQQECEEWLRGQIDDTIAVSIQRLMSMALSRNSIMTDTVFREKCISAVQSELAERHISTIGITVSVSQFPDFSLYAAVKQEYLKKNAPQSTNVATQVQFDNSGNSLFLTLEQWGILLTKYPVLAELLKSNNGDPMIFKEMIKMGATPLPN